METSSEKVEQRRLTLEYLHSGNAIPSRNKEKSLYDDPMIAAVFSQVNRLRQLKTRLVKSEFARQIIFGTKVEISLTRVESDAAGLYPQSEKSSSYLTYDQWNDFCDWLFEDSPPYGTE